MNTPLRPPLKSLPDTPDRPSSAEPVPATAGSGAPKVVALGVLSALRSDRHQHNQQNQERVFFGRHANGRAAGVPLIEDYTSHKKTCAHHTSSTERRAA
ncbi:hypothetical protein [Streptomyces decoyicus]|uniref:hypothetical protein n=1 Tax=Streptomyces decoyicus TaxID=249567 RepID=UPI0037FF3CD4